MADLGDKLHQSINNYFNCEKCYFKCRKKGDYARHLQTAKHTRLSLANKNDITSDIKNAECVQQLNVCDICSKEYKSRNGLWKHKQKCSYIGEMPVITPTTQITPELVMKIIEQNKELQQTLIDQNKVIIDLAQKAGSYNTTNNNCGNNNKTFNLQFFLNETCKNAINMTDFINQIQISLGELEDTGRLGYAEGISKVFIKNLNDIDYKDRPIHCSDLKRETLYIKDNNQWAKDDANKTGLTKAIKLVANKNIRQISEWQKCHPHYSDPESKQNDKYMQIVLNSMSGSSKEESDKNYEKIAKNVIKEVVIEKN